MQRAGETADPSVPKGSADVSRRIQVGTGRHLLSGSMPIGYFYLIGRQESAPQRAVYIQLTLNAQRKTQNLPCHPVHVFNPT